MLVQSSRCLTLVLAAATLAGCSEYLHHNDTLSWQSGNAVQTDKLTQMVDPWPAVSANRNIAFDGAVMESAMTRYRTGRVIQPKGLTSSGSSSSDSNSNNSQSSPGSAPLGPTVNSQSGSVK